MLSLFSFLSQVLPFPGTSPQRTLHAVAIISLADYKSIKKIFETPFF
jgi:hypothetical protein